MRLAYFRDLLNRLELGPHGFAALLHDDGTVFMRLPFDRNDIGRTVDASAPFHAFMRDGATPVVAVDPIDHVQRQFVFRRVGKFPLVVSIGLANDASLAGWLAGFWLTILGTVAFCTLSALLAYRLSCERRQREAAERESQEKSRFLTTLSHESAYPAAWRARLCRPVGARRSTQSGPVAASGADHASRQAHARRGQCRAGLCPYRGAGTVAPHASDRHTALWSRIASPSSSPAPGRAGWRQDHGGARRPGAFRDGRRSASADPDESARAMP